MAHLSNFSFELFYAVFTQDAPLFFLYHGAKSKNSNQGVLPSEPLEAILVIFGRFCLKALGKI